MRFSQNRCKTNEKQPKMPLPAALGALLTTFDDPSWRKLGSKMPSETILRQKHEFTNKVSGRSEIGRVLSSKVSWTLACRGALLVSSSLDVHLACYSIHFRELWLACHLHHHLLQFPNSPKGYHHIQVLPTRVSLLHGSPPRLVSKF